MSASPTASTAGSASNPNAKILALLYVSIAMVLVGGLLLYGVSSTGFGEAMWENVALVGIDFTAASATESSLSARVVAVASALGGMFITALLLGIVSDAVGDYVDDLKKGRSDVLETNHTLVLGWSDKTLPIVEQVSNANESEGGGVIVILAEMEKERQEELIAEFEYESLGTRVICRGQSVAGGGSQKGECRRCPLDHHLGGRRDGGPSRRQIMRVVCLVGLRAKCASKGHIVCEMCDVDNEPLVRMVGGEAVETIVAHDVIGRLMIQCARQPGLAQVWNDVLGFEGCEFYCSEHPELVGCSFDDVVLRFADARRSGCCDIKSDDQPARTVKSCKGVTGLSYWPRTTIVMKSVPNPPILWSSMRKTCTHLKHRDRSACSSAAGGGT